MKHVNIIYYEFYNLVSAEMSIGGIQTYIKKLCGVIRSIGFAVRVFQCSNKPFDIIVDDVEIIGLCIDKKKLSRTALQSIPKE